MCRQHEPVYGVQRQYIVRFQIGWSGEVQVLIQGRIALFILPRILMSVESWIHFYCSMRELHVHPIGATNCVESRCVIEIGAFIVAGDAEVQSFHVKESLSLAPQLNTFL